MAMQRRTLELIEAARLVLSDAQPLRMTLRQVLYQLVSGLVIVNTLSRYKALSDALVRARQDGTIPWEWMEDRNRRPRHVYMWASIADYADTVRLSYRRNVELDFKLVPVADRKSVV